LSFKPVTHNSILAFVETRRPQDFCIYCKADIEMSNETMKAVVFKGKLKVEVEDRPIPKIQDPTDIIVKVTYSALCGSELHVFRGHQPSKTDFIM